MSFSVPPASLQPVLQFNFGFSTDEAGASGGFLDSFSVTLQSDNGLTTALLLTADASGVEQAPSNPGGLLINPDEILRSPISVPAFAQGFSNTLAYSVTFPVPTDYAGKPATLYFDLFDNLTPPNSLGWADNVAVVPEPSIAALGLLGAALVRLRINWRES